MTEKAAINRDSSDYQKKATYLCTRNLIKFQNFNTFFFNFNYIKAMKHSFYNKNTKFDPDYRNVQAELWEKLNDDQQWVVAKAFKHLKNLEQIEIAEALIDQIETGIQPDPRDWSDSFVANSYLYISNRIFYKPL